MKKLFNTSKTKNFWVEIVLGALCILAAIIFAPIWAKTNVFFKDWGKAIVDLLIAALIVVYLAGVFVEENGKVGRDYPRAYDS